MSKVINPDEIYKGVDKAYIFYIVDFDLDDVLDSFPITTKNKWRDLMAKGFIDFNVLKESNSHGLPYFVYEETQIFTTQKNIWNTIDTFAERSGWNAIEKRIFLTANFAAIDAILDELTRRKFKIYSYFSVFSDRERDSKKTELMYSTFISDTPAGEYKGDKARDTLVKETPEDYRLLNSIADWRKALTIHFGYVQGDKWNINGVAERPLFKLGDLFWASVNHYILAQMYLHPTMRPYIELAHETDYETYGLRFAWNKHSEECRKLGIEEKPTILKKGWRNGWVQIYDEVLRKAQLARFSQDALSLSILKATNDAQLTFITTNNRLVNEHLEAVRSELRGVEAEEQLDVPEDQVFVDDGRNFDVDTFLAANDMGLRPHQVRAVKFLLKNKGLLAWHDTGTGKTRLAIACIAAILEAYPKMKVLIITPLSVEGSFKNEMNMLGVSSFNRRIMFTSKDMVYNAYKRDKTLVAMLKNIFVVADEAHFMRNLQREDATGITKAAVMQSIIIRANKALMLTATPFVNSTTDVWALLNALPREQKCKMSIFRRDESDDYPRLVHVDRNWENELPDPSVLDGIEMGLYAMKGKIELLNYKIPLAFNFIKEVMDENSTNKLAIYIPLRVNGVIALRKLLDNSEYKDMYSEISGKVPKKSRLTIIKAYNTRRIRIIIFTQAGAEGMNLMETSHLLLMDQTWNLNTEDQIIGRAQRYKSHAKLPPERRVVYVYRLLFRNWSFERKIFADSLAKQSSIREAAASIMPLAIENNMDCDVADAVITLPVLENEDVEERLDIFLPKINGEIISDTFMAYPFNNDLYVVSIPGGLYSARGTMIGQHAGFFSRNPSEYKVQHKGGVITEYRFNASQLKRVVEYIFNQLPINDKIDYIRKKWVINRATIYLLVDAKLASVFPDMEVEVRLDTITDTVHTSTDGNVERGGLGFNDIFTAVMQYCAIRLRMDVDNPSDIELATLYIQQALDEEIALYEEARVETLSAKAVYAAYKALSANALVRENEAYPEAVLRAILTLREMGLDTASAGEILLPHRYRDGFYRTLVAALPSIKEAADVPKFPFRITGILPAQHLLSRVWMYIANSTDPQIIANVAFFSGVRNTEAEIVEKQFIPMLSTSGIRYKKYVVVNIASDDDSQEVYARINSIYDTRPVEVIPKQGQRYDIVPTQEDGVNVVYMYEPSITTYELLKKEIMPAKIYRFDGMINGVLYTLPPPPFVLLNRDFPVKGDLQIQGNSGVSTIFAVSDSSEQQMGSLRYLSALLGVSLYYHDSTVYPGAIYENKLGNYTIVGVQHDHVGDIVFNDECIVFAGEGLEMLPKARVYSMRPMSRNQEGAQQDINVDGLDIADPRIFILRRDEIPRFEAYYYVGDSQKTAVIDLVDAVDHTASDNEKYDTVRMNEISYRIYNYIYKRKPFDAEHLKHKTIYDRKDVLFYDQVGNIPKYIASIKDASGAQYLLFLIDADSDTIELIRRLMVGTNVKIEKFRDVEDSNKPDRQLLILHSRRRGRRVLRHKLLMR